MEFLIEEFLQLGLVIKGKRGGLEDRSSASQEAGNPETTLNWGVAAWHGDSVPAPSGAAERSNGPASPAGPKRAATAGPRPGSAPGRPSPRHPQPGMREPPARPRRARPPVQGTPVCSPRPPGAPRAPAPRSRPGALRLRPWAGRAARTPAYLVRARGRAGALPPRPAAAAPSARPSAGPPPQLFVSRAPRCCGAREAG